MRKLPLILTIPICLAVSGLGVSGQIEGDDPVKALVGRLDLEKYKVQSKVSRSSAIAGRAPIAIARPSIGSRRSSRATAVRPSASSMSTTRRRIPEAAAAAATPGWPKAVAVRAV